MSKATRLPVRWLADQDLVALWLGSLDGEELETVTCDVPGGSVMLVMDVGVSSHRIAGFEVVPASKAFSWMSEQQRHDASAMLDVDAQWRWVDVRLTADMGGPEMMMPFRCERVPGVFGCLGDAQNVFGFRIPDPKHRLPERLVATMSADG